MGSVVETASGKVLRRFFRSVALGCPSATENRTVAEVFPGARHANCHVADAVNWQLTALTAETPW